MYKYNVHVYVCLGGGFIFSFLPIPGEIQFDLHIF